MINTILHLSAYEKSGVWHSGFAAEQRAQHAGLGKGTRGERAFDTAAVHDKRAFGYLGSEC